MTKQISIRPVKKSDLNALAGIFTEAYRAFDVGERWTKESARKLLSYWLNRQPDLTFLAERDGKIVGAFLSGIKPWWDGNRLDGGEIFVHPEHQKHGIGRELLKHTIQNAIEKYDAETMEAATFKNFKFPLSWYKALGFKEIQEWILISGDLKKILKKLK